MRISPHHQLAAELARRITLPSNSTGADTTTSASQYFYPEKSHPVYTTNVEGPTLGSTHKLLDDLYHKNTLLRRIKPDNYRIGSNSPLQADMNELGRLLVYDLKIQDLVEQNLITREELDKTLTLLIDYSGLSDLEFYYLYLYIHKYRFNEPWGRLSGSGGLAYGQPELAERLLAECMTTQKKSISTSGAFSQWTHSFRQTFGNDWFFERFLKQVNGPKTTGITQTAPPQSKLGSFFRKPAPSPPPTKPNYFYTKFSPSMPQYKQRGITIHDFPGPGLVVNGFHSPLFPKQYDYLGKRFLKGIVESANQTDFDYRRLMVNGEAALSKTRFAFFRGLYLVYNPEHMRVDGRPYGLLVLNDHFPYGHTKTAYLVHGEFVEKFMKDPYLATGNGNIFNPDSLERRSELSGKLIKLVSVAATAGLCEEVPGYDPKAMNSGKRISLHENVKDAALFAHSQLDLVREAFRLFRLGFKYSREIDNFYQDEFELLKELLRVNKKAKAVQKIDEPIPELPVAFPFTFFDHRVDDAMVRDVGFTGANMVFYKNREHGDCQFFPDGNLSCIDPEDLDDMPQERIQELIGGELEYQKWREFIEASQYKRANPLIVDPVYTSIGKRIIAM